ncbi:MAG: beta-Ala-His dipeptidase [Candidatus Thorarchaeota archaeon]
MIKLKEIGKPDEFWNYFEQISQIPRCSGREERIRNYIKAEGEKFGFKTKVDKIGNLAIFIPGKSETKEKLILQCHMDMVCEKNSNIAHDFTKDPLKLKVLEIDNEKWITAEGTTLGADNGTGVCFNLTLMKKVHEGNLSFKNLSIELLFTVLEEVRLGGARDIDKDMVDGNLLINLDSGRDGMITNGCTGGIGFITDVKTNPFPVSQVEDKLIPLKISLIGLIGGHSGGDINRGRANAIKFLSQILWKLNQNYTIYIHSINGGGAANAIPREAFTKIYVKENELPEIKSIIHSLFLEIKTGYEGIEQNIQILTEELKLDSNDPLISREIQKKLLDLLYILPSGPLVLHPKIRALAFASANIGIIKTEKEHIRLRMLLRSFNRYYNDNTYEKIMTLLDLSNLEMTITKTGFYPPWEPNYDSRLLNLAKEAYKELSNQDPLIILIQGGLEPTLLINLKPDMEAIAIGPTARDVHSPDEMLNVNSVEKTWNFILKILQKLD